MKKQGIFVILVILAVGSIFFSFIDSMNYSGNVVRDLDCSLAMNEFESSKKNYNCDLKREGEISVERCNVVGETMIYEYSPNEFKKWIFIKNDKEEIYFYDLKNKVCEKR